MNTRRESKRRGGRRSVGMQLIGLGGLVCIAWAITGLVLSLSNRNSTSVSSGVVELEPAVQAAGAENFSRSVSESSHEVLSPSYYPLQVGRYWVYIHVDEKSESVMEIARRIVRRARRDGRELFFFDDGSMVYNQNGKIFEIGSEGGVNVVPIGSGNVDVPYVYRTQGLHIEKRIGATSTTMKLGEREFTDCLEVVTRFRRVDQDTSRSMAYSSYYSSGIGLVARAKWFEGSHSEPTMILQNFGPNRL